MNGVNYLHDYVTILNRLGARSAHPTYVGHWVAAIDWLFKWCCAGAASRQPSANCVRVRHPVVCQVQYNGILCNFCRLSRFWKLIRCCTYFRSILAHTRRWWKRWRSCLRRVKWWSSWWLGTDASPPPAPFSRWCGSKASSATTTGNAYIPSTPRAPLPRMSTYRDLQITSNW